MLRKNFDINLLLFNNQIYGLTKGQYSPTSEAGKVTKSTPFGSVEQPFNPAELALGAKATFVSRTMDRDPKHMQATLRKAHDHKGTSFVEIYQNCPVFNDGAFFIFSDKETKKNEALFLEHGKPLIFGVTLPLGKPFLAACLGGAVGGALISYWKVATVITFGLSGLPLALTIVTGKVMLYLLGYLVAVIAGFLFTWLLGFNDPEE